MESTGVVEVSDPRVDGELDGLVVVEERITGVLGVVECEVLAVLLLILIITVLDVVPVLKEDVSEVHCTIPVVRPLSLVQTVI